MSDSGEQIAEVNSFLRGHKVLSVEQHFLPLEHGGSWCFCVRYIEGPMASPVPSNASKFGSSPSGKKDYREILDAGTFAVFSLLRECRKQVANEQLVAAYVIFTDEELSNLAQLKELTEKTMQTVNGVGSKKVEKYGKRVLELYLEKKNGLGKALEKAKEEPFQGESFQVEPFAANDE
jgi:superfamily II DNA helicase RecQ